MEAGSLTENGNPTHYLIFFSVRVWVQVLPVQVHPSPLAAIWERKRKNVLVNVLVNSVNLIFEWECCADFSISALQRIFTALKEMSEQISACAIGFVPPVLGWSPPTLSAVTNEVQHHVLCGNGFQTYWV